MTYTDEMKFHFFFTKFYIVTCKSRIKRYRKKKFLKLMRIIIIHLAFSYLTKFVQISTVIIIKDCFYSLLTVVSNYMDRVCFILTFINIINVLFSSKVCFKIFKMYKKKKT